MTPFAACYALVLQLSVLIIPWRIMNSLALHVSGTTRSVEHRWCYNGGACVWFRSLIQYLKFSWLCWWRFRTTGMWCYIGCVVLMFLRIVVPSSSRSSRPGRLQNVGGELHADDTASHPRRHEYQFFVGWGPLSMSGEPQAERSREPLALLMQQIVMIFILLVCIIRY
jgi:hypothetical protein